MNARIAALKVRAENEPTVEKSQPKQRASAFDHALDHASSPKHAPKAHTAQEKAQPKKRDAQQHPQQQQNPQQQPSPEDAVRNARLLAALNAMPTALQKSVLASTGKDAPRFELPESNEPVGAMAHVSAPHAKPAVADDDSKVESADDASSDDAALALPEGMEATDEDFEMLQQRASTSANSADTSSADPTATDIDPAQIAELIASAQPVQEHKETMKTSSPDEHGSHGAITDIAALDSRQPTNVAQPTVAVEKAAAPRSVEMSSIAETIANGSIEGNRARVVIGQGDDRIVLTVSTHAHKVTVEVDPGTQAGAQLAKHLEKGGADDLAQALKQHGLELEQRTPQHQQPETEREEPPLQLAPKKQVTQAAIRPTGVVA